jgi:hypothetical protein
MHSCRGLLFRLSLKYTPCPSHQTGALATVPLHIREDDFRSDAIGLGVAFRATPEFFNFLALFDPCSVMGSARKSASHCRPSRRSSRFNGRR